MHRHFSSSALAHTYNAITCCLQSVQKKATLQFKSLDATLQTYNKDTHQKEAVTYRCADINAMVPSLMGVSKVCLQYLMI